MAVKTKTPSLVAVYGTLRPGGHNNTLLDDASHVGPDWVGPYTMLDMGGLPCVSTKETQYIMVDVYDVSEECLFRLDALEGHPWFYERRLIHTAYGDAWLYFIANETELGDSIPVPGEIADWIEYITGNKEVL